MCGGGGVRSGFTSSSQVHIGGSEGTLTMWLSSQTLSRLLKKKCIALKFICVFLCCVVLCCVLAYHATEVEIRGHMLSLCSFLLYHEGSGDRTQALQQHLYSLIRLAGPQLCQFLFLVAT